MEGLIFGILRQFQHGIQIRLHTSCFKSAFTRILNERLVNFLVSASNELGKVWEETEEENLVPFVKIVKGTGEYSGRGSVKFEEGFPPIHSGLPPPPPLSNDRILINLLTDRDYLSALNKRFSRASILISPDTRAGSVSQISIHSVSIYSQLL